eukprot:6187136-Pleurochrysis_carterae.AAC.3
MITRTYCLPLNQASHPEIEYIFYLDADNFILRPDIALQTFISATGMHMNRSVVITAGTTKYDARYGSVPRFQGSTILFRRTPWTMWFLRGVVGLGWEIRSSASSDFMPVVSVDAGGFQKNFITINGFTRPCTAVSNTCQTSAVSRRDLSLGHFISLSRSLTLKQLLATNVSQCMNQNLWLAAYYNNWQGPFALLAGAVE